jgi:hypothetical protein
VVTEPPSDGAIDEECQTWQQGDAFEGQALPMLTIGADRLQAEDFDLIAIVSQTCDVVRRHVDRPTVVLAPVVRLEGDLLAHARRGRIPRLVALPGVDHDAFVDLDRVTTVDKMRLAGRTRTRGCRNAEELRRFEAGVARHFGRAAYPDDFTATMRPLADRLAKRASKESPEGRRVDELMEIRVRPSPTWDSEAVEVTLTFVVDDTSLPIGGEPADVPPLADSTIELLSATLDRTNDPFERAAAWQALVGAWAELCTPSGVITSVDAVASTIGDLSGREYRDSAPLDLDYLSVE